jgi:HEAT repeat
MKLTYKSLEPISRREAEKLFAEGTPSDIGEALYRLANHENDWEWVERWCLHFCKHPAPRVRAIAANCLADLARIHRDKKIKRVVPVLTKLLNDNDPGVAYEAKSALEDFEIFLGPKSN